MNLRKGAVPCNVPLPYSPLSLHSLPSP